MEYNYIINNNIILLELKNYKKYFDVLYYKIKKLDEKTDLLYKNNKKELEKYIRIIYPEVILLYMEVKNNIKINNDYNILLKMNKLKYYANLYSYK